MCSLVVVGAGWTMKCVKGNTMSHDLRCWNELGEMI
jgi:hypothetical protein